MLKKISIAIGILAIAILVLVITHNRSSSISESIKLGAALAITGEAGSWGEEELKAVELAVEEWNERGGIDGKPVELFVADTKTENVHSVSAVKKLIEVDGVDAIVGPSWFDSFPASAPFSDSSDIVMITPSGSITGMKSIAEYPNVFSTWYRADKEHWQLAEYLAGKGLREVVALNPNDVFCINSTQHLRDAAEEVDIEVVEEYLVNRDFDIKTEIAKIVEQDPDVVYLCLYEANMVEFLKQRQALGMRALPVATEYIEDFASRPDIVGLFEGVQFVAPNISKTGFHERYKERFGAGPVFSAQNAYDAANILLEAINEVGADTSTIREYLLNTTFQTETFGAVEFDDIGGATKSDFVIKEFVDEGVEVVAEL